jgi:hypothetical protein
MKRLVLIALMLSAGSIRAHADNDIYNGQNDALHADAGVCDAQFGAPQNGTVTLRQYKRCMLSHGWRFSHTIRERARRDDRYPRPDVQGFHHRRRHRIELLEFLKG